MNSAVAGSKSFASRRGMHALLLRCKINKTGENDAEELAQIGSFAGLFNAIY